MGEKHKYFEATLIAFFCISVYAYADQRQEARVEKLQQASKLMEDHDFQSAEALLQPMTGSSSPDGIALNLLGLIRVQQHRTADAKRIFERAIAVNPRIIGPRLNLAALYGNAQPFEAIAQLKQVIEMVPNSASAQALLRDIARDSSLEATRSGDKLRSLSILAKAREIIPEDTELLYEFGLSALDAGSLRDAQQVFAKLLLAQPNYSNVHYALARVFLAESNPQQAEDQMRQYLSAKPDDATAHYGLGYILAAEQKTDDARAEFQESLTLEPNQTESLFSLGELEEEQGHQAAALEYFNKVLARDSKHTGALTGVGILDYRAGDYSAARVHLSKAIAAAPSYQKAHYYYALTLRRLDLKSDSDHEFEISKSLQKLHGGIPSLESAHP